jgi:hypothetical protein
MALNAYLSAVRTLLHDPFGQFYTDATLTGFINEARQQVALEGECINGIGTIPTVAAQQLYQNLSVTVPSVPTGISQLITPRSISFALGSSPNGGLLTLENRNWDWFNFYWLGFAAPPPGPPAAWAPREIGQGGSFYIGPAPDNGGPYSLLIDGVWSPDSLVSDTTPEAIPYPWIDAVQFYAAFKAFLDAQRKADAGDVYTVYENTMQRARGIVTPLREEKTFPGGLAARTPPGMAPPTLPSAGRGPRQ